MENPYLPPSAAPAVETPTGSLRDNRSLGWIVVGIILANALIRTLNDVLASLVNNGNLEGTPEFLRFLNITRYSVSGIYFIAAVFYSVWIYRTAWNARNYQGFPLSTSPGMAVACYFIPIYSIFGPCLSMREIVKISYRNHPGRSILPLVVPWWICYFGATAAMYSTSKLAEMSFGFYLKLALWDLSSALISFIIVRLSTIQAETVIEDFTPQMSGPRPAPRYATLPPLS